MKEHIRRTRINRNELADWIEASAHDSLMLTISKPHAKTDHLQLELSDMEPVIARIIELSNKFVFGKHKRFEWMRGVVAMEGGKFQPHFHIVFQKPSGMEFDRFKTKLTKVAEMLCDENFEFSFDYDAMDWYPTKKVQKALTRPCYNRFARVSDAHEKLGDYLTKASDTEYFMIDGRKPRLSRSRLDVFVDYFNGMPAFSSINPRTETREFGYV